MLSITIYPYLIRQSITKQNATIRHDLMTYTILKLKLRPKPLLAASISMSNNNMWPKSQLSILVTLDEVGDVWECLLENGGGFLAECWDDVEHNILYTSLLLGVALLAPASDTQALDLSCGARHSCYILRFEIVDNTKFQQMFIIVDNIVLSTITNNSRYSVFPFILRFILGRQLGEIL